MGTLRPINPHTASLIANPQAAAHDYDNLTHKPQINGHELSGDQSGSDLGLQNQLTAGDNVTIDENGVISAEGGTDDYNDLENKPSINNVPLSGNKTSGDLGLQKSLNSSETISVGSDGLLNIQEKSIDFRFFTDVIRDVILYTNSIFSNATENGYLNGLQKNTIVYINFNEVREDDRRNLPTNAFDGYFITISCKDSQWMQLAIDNYYPNKNYIRFGQPMWGSSFPRYNQWQEIGGGSQPASGVVNQNGTISFYDADGNLLFTTTGEKIVTSGNQQISMGYDSGGFYFLFDDGQEVVNNGTN